MKALVTGGTGFLGANLALGLLQQGWSVRILRRMTSPLAAVKDLDVEHAIGDITRPGFAAGGDEGRRCRVQRRGHLAVLAQ